MNAAVRLTTNENQLLRNLEFAFSNRTTFLAELAQNARRAGATMVSFLTFSNESTLIVSDDGHGISDFQNLFTVAQSGWDPETCDEERPFGMGFVSTFFACESITIESCGMKIRASTADILEQKTFKVETGTVTSGTRLTLENVKFDLKDIDRQLQQTLDAFAIRVSVNGKEIKRPYALDENTADQTSVGWMTCRGLEQPDFSIGEYAFFLQGMRIASGGYTHHPHVIVHLDSTKFRAKLPDRNVLLNAKEEVERVQAEARAVVARKLKELLEALSEEELVQTYWYQMNRWAPELLADVQLAPTRLFVKPQELLCDATWHEPYFAVSETVHGKLVSRSLIQGDTVRVVQGDASVDIHEDNHSAIKRAYVIANGGWIMNGRVQETHWAAKLPTIDELDVTFEVVSPEAEISVRDISDLDALVPCALIRLSGPWGTVDVSDQEIVVRDDEGYTRAYSPRSAMNAGRGIRQIDPFSVDECLDDDYRDEIEGQLIARLKESRGADPLDLLNTELRKIQMGTKSARNARFEVLVDEHGNVRALRRIDS